MGRAKKKEEKEMRSERQLGSSLYRPCGLQYAFRI